GSMVWGNIQSTCQLLGSIRTSDSSRLELIQSLPFSQARPWQAPPLSAGPNGIWRWLTCLPLRSVWKTPLTGGLGWLRTDTPLAPLQTQPSPKVMPLVFWLLVTTVLSTLPVLKSSSQAFSRSPSWRCSCTQKPLAGSTAMPLGQPAGVRNSGVVLALRVGIFFCRSGPGPRPSSSTPRGRSPWASAAEALNARPPSPSPVARNFRLSICSPHLERSAFLPQFRPRGSRAFAQDANIAPGGRSNMKAASISKSAGLPEGGNQPAWRTRRFLLTRWRAGATIAASELAGVATAQGLRAEQPAARGFA